MFSFNGKHWWQVGLDNTQPPIVLMKWLDRMAFCSPALSPMSPSCSLRKILWPVYVAARGFLFCLLTDNIETYFCLKTPVCPKADEVAHFPPSHRNGCLLCFRLKLLWLFHSRYRFFVFCLFFSTSIPIPLRSLLSLCGRGSSGFCVVTVLNIEHKRKRDTQAKASFWYSNYEQLLGWHNSQFEPVYFWLVLSSSSFHREFAKYFAGQINTLCSQF